MLEAKMRPTKRYGKAASQSKATKEISKIDDSGSVSSNFSAFSEPVEKIINSADYIG